MSIQFPYIVQSRSQQSGVNPDLLYCTEPVSAVWCQSSLLYCTESVSAVWCQSCFLILYRVGLSSLVSILFPYIVQSRSQQSGVNPVCTYCTEPVSAVWCQSCFLYCTESVSAVWCQSCFPILYRVGSQQSGVNPVSLYCTESVSAVWIDTRLPRTTLYNIGKLE